MDFGEALSSHNLAFLEALYEAFRDDPGSVEPHWRDFFEGRAPAPALSRQKIETPRGGNGIAPAPGPDPGASVIAGIPSAAIAATGSSDAEQIVLQNRVDRMIAHYRQLGHLGAELDPLGRPPRATTPGLDPRFWGLEDSHLQREFNPGRLFDGHSTTLDEILGRLRRTYCRHVGVEYWHLHDAEQREWLRDTMESCENEVVPDQDEQRRLLRSLARVDDVDKFLHSKFLGAKRFSLAGGESTIALLETLIEEAGAHGVEELGMGMAHRGRLNVLMNILGKTPADIFSEFESGDPWETLGSGDVKYHKGASHRHTTRGGKQMYLSLGFNPSHLEAITPVTVGRVRARQDYLGDRERKRVLAITMHGDAAMMGQGVFAETLNLSQLDGYATGGTIRIVINNQIGFTTDPEESRSTVYCTAVTDMLGVPILHVNGDDPEAAAYAARLAIAYRQRFGRDVVIDVVCYRRFGHNEGDEPGFTQPTMYDVIKDLASVRDRYQALLCERGTVTVEQCAAMDAELHSEFDAALHQIRSDGVQRDLDAFSGVWEGYRGGPDSETPTVDTRIPAENLERVRHALVHVPEGFNLHPKLRRLLDQEDQMLRGDAPLSWSVAERVAYGSLLVAGTNVRLTGQDVLRGTFTHRHAAWTDTQTGEPYVPLSHVGAAQGRFMIHNSPLSEYAVVGFEYGYSLAAPHALVIWEAQFGDFVNGAQVMIDQFISSSEDKWNRVSGLVLLLPHGFEGQGPEHSSARLERFLQLCAEDNMQVCNPTTPAQLFHALRRQVLRRWRKPLVVMTPKSMLRFRPSFSPLEELTQGSFRRLIPDVSVHPQKVTRVLMCSGKIYYDLAATRERLEREDVAIVRVEQLYPFPSQPVIDTLNQYERATELFWVQDEPRNMGAWTFVRPHLEKLAGRRARPRFIGRVESASPATGVAESHKLELELILEDAFRKSA